MAAESVNKWRVDVLLVFLLVLLLLAALHMMSGAVQRSEELGSWFVPLILFTVSGLVILVFMMGWNLWQLLRDYRARVAGSKLSARLTLFFVLLALAPVSVTYFYSLQFLSSGIDSWFDVQIDSAMEDALNLSRVSLDLHKTELLKATETALTALEDSSITALALSVTDLRETLGAEEMTLFSPQGDVLATSHADPDVLVPNQPDGAQVQQVISGKNYVGLVPLENDRLVIRALVLDPRQRGLVLQALFRVSDSLRLLTDNVQEAYEVYKERAYLRTSIKFSFALTLSLVLLLGLFAAVWAAVYTARRIVQPVTDIAAGTRAVAAGDYDKRLPLPRVHDELGFLVSSFNAMTRRIAQARNAAEESRRELQTQHAYLETVLGGLSTGVMALDADRNIQTANPAADQILRLPLVDYRGRELGVLAQASKQLEPFIERICDGLERGVREGSAEITLYRNDGRQVLLCRHSTLEFGTGTPAGHVLVFDDVTELVKAQRDAAWAEVARRLAHEIKNPLTPIQLSAERLRRKYLRKLEGADRDLLDRSTQTIVQQVEAMKTMVNDFSDYAKPSRMEPEPFVLDAYLGDVMGLYDAYAGKVRFEPGAPGVEIKADKLRLRQVLLNLIKNGQEATEGAGLVVLSTRAGRERDSDYVEICVVDDGPGFDPGLLGRVFDPYVTSKPRGTGLGLAIVKRIVGEHGGSIRAENVPGGGGLVVIRLPVRAGGDDGVPALPRAANAGETEQL